MGGGGKELGPLLLLNPLLGVNYTDIFLSRNEMFF